MATELVKIGSKRNLKFTNLFSNLFMDSTEADCFKQWFSSFTARAKSSELTQEEVTDQLRIKFHPDGIDKRTKVDVDKMNG